MSKQIQEACIVAATRTPVGKALRGDDVGQELMGSASQLFLQSGSVRYKQEGQE